MKKNYFSKQKLIMTAVASIFAFLPMLVAAAPVFPGNAGIAAYVKLDSFSIDDYNRAKQNYFNTLDSFVMGDTYVVGIKTFSVSDAGGTAAMKPYYVYLGNDGWLVTYLWKEDYGQFSQIINWRNGAALDNTMLKVAIEDAATKIRVTYSDSIKYYDFSHPEATKMTIIRESVDTGSANSNDFSVYVPGTIYSASYSVNCESCSDTSGAYVSCSNGLSTNRIGNGFFYGSYKEPGYPYSLIPGNKSHKITIRRDNDTAHPVLGSLIIYKTN